MPLRFDNNIKFRNVPEQRIEEFNFTGGLITDAHETKLEPNQSPDLANVIFNDTGSIKTRDGYLRYNTDPVGSASDEANTGASTGTVTIDAPGDYVAQTFQVGTGADMVQVDLYLEMDTSGQEQYMQAELWSGSTGPSAFIADGQVLLISGATETKYSFRFRVPQTLTATTEYAIVLKPYIRGSSQTVNSVLVHRTGDAYASGAAYSSVDSGETWSAISSVDLKFNVFTGGSTGGTGLIRYYNSTGTQQLLAKFGTSLYRGNDVSGAMTALTLGSGVSLTAANFLDWTIVNDTLLVVDGEHYIQKYRGSTNANYTTGTISVTNGDATVTGSGTSWNTVTNAAVGEYIKLPDGKWYMIASIASDTSLEIEITDANGGYQGSTLAGQTYTISPWGEVQGKLDTSTAPASLVRPQPSFIENHINRVWTLEGNTLRFSALDTSIPEENFNDWDTSNNAGQINIPAGKGDTGTGLYSLNGYLYIFQRNAIWEVFGSSPNNFELRNISNEVGMVDKRSLIEYDRYIIFFSGKDIYLFDGANLKNLTDGKVNNLITSWANTTSPVAVLWENKYVLSYTPSSGSTNSEALFYDITRDVFGKLEGVYASEWSVWDGGSDTNQIYFISSNQGTIYQWATGGHDDGYEIETRYSTPSLGFVSGMHDKAAKRFYLQQLALGDWNMAVTQYSDINAETTSGSNINLSPGDASLWDVFLWDTDVWSAEGSLVTTRIAEFQGIAKYFRYKLSQTGYNEGIEVLGILVTARLRRLQ